VLPGVASVTVSLRSADGSWTQAARRDGLFFRRNTLIDFPAVSATAVRVRVLSVNIGGYAGGLTPYFWATDAASLADPTQATYGPAIVRELEVYGAGNKADISAPAAPNLEVPASLERSTAKELPIAGTAEPGSRVQLELTSGASTRTATAWVDAEGRFRVSVDTSALPDGPLTVTGTAVDTSSNYGAPALTSTQLTTGVPPRGPDAVSLPVPRPSGEVVPATPSTSAAPTTPSASAALTTPSTSAAPSTPVPGKRALWLRGVNLTQESPLGGKVRPLQVRVTDANGRPVAGVAVRFRRSAGAASVRFTSAQPVRTGTTGWATAPLRRVGTAPGKVVVVARPVGGTRVVRFHIVVSKTLVLTKPSRLASWSSSYPGGVSAVDLRAAGVPRTAREVVLRVSTTSSRGGSVAVGSRTIVRVPAGAHQGWVTAALPRADSRLAFRSRGTSRVTVDVVGWHRRG